MWVPKILGGNLIVTMSLESLWRLSVGCRRGGIVASCGTN